jgi:quercetin dioxygenase-like cupin family protein
MSVSGAETVKLVPIGDKVIFENESIRVWSFTVKPGGLKPMHRHDLPYLIVPVTPGRVEITTIEGKSREGEDALGSVIWQNWGETHQLRNLGDQPYQNILVELKKHDPNAPGAKQG